MKSSKMFLALASGALLAAGTLANGQVTFYTGSSQIVNSDGLLTFSDLVQYGQSLVNYTDQGLIVNCNDVSFVTGFCGFNNINAYYPNGGVNERIVVTKVSGGDFQILETQVSHGFGGCTIYVWMTAYLNGNPVADFDADVTGGTLVGCSGIFDELRIASYQTAQIRDTHDPAQLNAIALDNMEHGNDGSGGGYTLILDGPCPGTKRVTWNGATPNVQQGIVFGNNLGNFIIPGGPCSGTQLGISGGIQLVNTISTGSGSGTVSGNAGTGACGHYLQLIEAGSCNTSNPAQI